jgi:hypothetical protein
MALRTTPQFVTPADFFNFWGVDLDSALVSNDNESNKANTFLLRVEDRMLTWIDDTTFRNVGWDELTDYQTEQLQKAILTQAMYVYRSSDISMDSGYDPDKGIIANRADLEKIEICSAALGYLKNAGLYNHVITNRHRYTRFVK